MPVSISNPVVLIGAFERHNFGDLLMGRVLGQFFKDQGMSPIFASILPADLREAGGMWVNAFADLAPFLPDDVPLVHVGGETLGCTLSVGLRMDMPGALHPKLAWSLAKSMNPTGLDDREFAYLTPPEETIRGKKHTWKHRYFYSLGGSSLNSADSAVAATLARTLESADWLSAREGKSLRNLREIGCSQAARTWDAGVLSPGLVDRAPTAEEERSPSPSGYLLFHANERYLREHKHSIAAQLRKLGGRFTKIKIIMAGTAQNHDSCTANEELRTLTSDSGVSVECSSNINVDDTLVCIRDAACIVSTSLHFRIVALAFGRPRVSLENEKVAIWADECDPTYPIDCPANELYSKVVEAMALPAEKARRLADTAQQESSASLLALCGKIRESPASKPVVVPAVKDPGTLQLPVGATCTIAPNEWSAELDRRILSDGAAIDQLKETISDHKRRLTEARERKRKGWRFFEFFRGPKNP